MHLKMYQTITNNYFRIIFHVIIKIKIKMFKLNIYSKVSM